MGRSDLFFDLAAFAVGIALEPARRTTVGAEDLVAGLLLAAEREVGTADRTGEVFESHDPGIGTSESQLEARQSFRAWGLRPGRGPRGIECTR